MKKLIIAIAVAMFMSISAGAQTTKVVTDSVTFMPTSVKIFEGLTKNGNPKYWIELPTESGVKKVNLTESHVKSDRLLALIERRDTQTGKYSYLVKFAEPKKRTSTSGQKADLSGLK